MFPTIQNHSWCRCSKQDEYVLGDIVSYYKNTGEGVTFICHRIVNETSGGFITKGDNNEIEDPWPVEKEEVFCKIDEVSIAEKLVSMLKN